MTRKKRRLMVLLLAGLGLGTATALTLTAFQDIRKDRLLLESMYQSRSSGQRAATRSVDRMAIGQDPGQP